MPASFQYGGLKTKYLYRIFTTAILSVLFLFSCKPSKKEEENRTPLAHVYDLYLYETDIADLVPKGSTSQDSVLLVKRYINNWVREKLLIKKAEDNLTDTLKEVMDIDKKLEDYRNSLITYAYESELVRQKLDTFVTDEEIQKYYDKNQNNFELKDNIIKVKYIKVSKKAPDILKLKNWYRSDLPKDSIALENYCRQYAENFYLDNNTWLLFEDLLKEVPIETYNKELFLKYNRFVEVQDSANLYFLNIKGFKIKNSISPLSFEKEKIRKIVLNKRKLHLISQMKEDLFDEALKTKKVEIFE